MNTITLNPPLSIIRPLTLRLRINLKIFWILSFSLILSLSAFYVFQVNSVVSENYQIQNYQRKLNEFSQENGTLEINSAQVNSLGNVEKQIQELGFEKVGKIHYLRVLETQVVTK